ncbi:MAG: GNAT family N-acetyltransferase [Lachnospiraceae bacterium]|jgi:GNAT superfamily N-acetyltransferase|nr:GNAT family N-acetyltransferase [uncultured Acetatifactor sp.]MCI9219075.1 GNAT family N-acetyltransferase [Lachnospiraceae bacterium]
MDIRSLKRQYEIRWAEKQDWVPAMEMIWRTFLQYEGKEYPEKIVGHFFDFITDYGLYEAFLKGKYLLMIALDEGRIIGAGTVRDGNHLSLLFVDDAYHYRGVGSSVLGRLCEYLKTEAGERCMSLEAASGAVNFYRKQGFRAVRPEMEISGIRLTPMEKVF